VRHPSQPFPYPRAGSALDRTAGGRVQPPSGRPAALIEPASCAAAISFSRLQTRSSFGTTRPGPTGEGVTVTGHGVAPYDVSHEADSRLCQLRRSGHKEAAFKAGATGLEEFNTPAATAEALEVVRRRLRRSRHTASTSWSLSKQPARIFLRWPTISGKMTTRCSRCPSSNCLHMCRVDTLRPPSRRPTRATRNPNLGRFQLWGRRITPARNGSGGVSGRGPGQFL
jgi:hypothetical protein